MKELMAFVASPVFTPIMTLGIMVIGFYVNLKLMKQEFGYLHIQVDKQESLNEDQETKINNLDVRVSVLEAVKKRRVE
jgi:hypothetical protein